jgi:hypothetical protein
LHPQIDGAFALTGSRKRNAMPLSDKAFSKLLNRHCSVTEHQLSKSALDAFQCTSKNVRIA